MTLDFSPSHSVSYLQHLITTRLYAEVVLRLQPGSPGFFFLTHTLYQKTTPPKHCVCRDFRILHISFLIKCSRFTSFFTSLFKRGCESHLQSHHRQKLLQPRHDKRRPRRAALALNFKNQLTFRNAIRHSFWRRDE
jgi:hypothetical protein